MDRREARRQFKEKKTEKGVFAIRCVPSSEVWVGSFANLDAARTGTWFMLRNGTHHNKTMQAAWSKHGEAAFEYEVLEKLNEDLSPLLLRDTLHDRQKYWKNQLGAAPV